MYAIGGCNTRRSVERFDVREGSWFSLPSTSINDRWCHGVSVVDNYIYCTGGGRLHHPKIPPFLNACFYQNESGFNLFALKSWHSRKHFFISALEIHKKTINFTQWTKRTCSRNLKLNNALK